MHRGGSRRWLALVGALVGAGLLLSVFAGTSLAHAAAERDRRAFDTATGEIASTYQLAVQRIADLTLAAAAEVSSGHESTTAGWEAWGRNLRIFDRYPEVFSLGFMVPVTPDRLGTYAAEVQADRGGTFQLLPPGERPLHCFLRLTQSRRPLPVPIGLDLCTLGTMDRLMATRDTGTVSYEGVEMGGRTWIGVQAAVYSGGRIPATVEARRAAFMGWMGLLADPEVILARSVGDHRGIAVSATYKSLLSEAEYRFGRRPDDAVAASRRFGDGWTITAWQKPIPSGIFDRGTALTIFVAGVALSLLMGTVLLLLQTGRARAERLVAIRTEQLRHQAMHDPLTGLANRLLILDRLEHLLARTRRSGTRGAALYLDLDGFKSVNDTYGHDAGDVVLQEVAARLQHSVRDADAIGRLGGDEFVVLVEDAAVETTAPQVADRILAALREPFELPMLEAPVRISTSIGIAVTSEDATATGLLREADLALYRSKAVGRDCWYRFDAKLLL